MEYEGKIIPNNFIESHPGFIGYNEELTPLFDIGRETVFENYSRGFDLALLEGMRKFNNSFFRAMPYGFARGFKDGIQSSDFYLGEEDKKNLNLLESLIQDKKENYSFENAFSDI